MFSFLGLSDMTTFGTFSGKDVPSQIASNGHIMRLEFQSDHSNTGKGFNISYTSKCFVCLPTSFCLLMFVNLYFCMCWSYWLAHSLFKSKIINKLILSPHQSSHNEDQTAWHTSLHCVHIWDPNPAQFQHQVLLNETFSGRNKYQLPFYLYNLQGNFVE